MLRERGREKERKRGRADGMPKQGKTGSAGSRDKGNSKAET